MRVVPHPSAALFLRLLSFGVNKLTGANSQKTGAPPSIQDFGSATVSGLPPTPAASTDWAEWASKYVVNRSLILCGKKNTASIKKTNRTGNDNNPLFG